jgi:hypothetical protein
MPAKCLDFHFHVGKERQVDQYIVELGGVLNLENTDICIPAGNPPNMPPYSFGLQILAHRFFLLPSIFLSEQRPYPVGD